MSGGVENPNRDNATEFISTCISLSFFTIDSLAITLWLVYHPIDPKFTIVSADVHALNVSSSPSQPSTTMQFTMAAKNLNQHASIYYDNLTTFVLYRNKRITRQVITLSSLSQDKSSTVLISPTLGGQMMPVALFDVDQNESWTRSDGVWLRIVLLGRVGWKVEFAISSIDIGYYALSVNCDVFLGIKEGFLDSLSLMDSSPSSHCNVDIQ